MVSRQEGRHWSKTSTAHHERRDSMKRSYDPTLKATVTLDESGQIRGINHLDEYREMEHLRGREAAQTYVRDIAGRLNIAPEALRNLEQPVSYFDPLVQDIEYRFSEE